MIILFICFYTVNFKYNSCYLVLVSCFICMTFSEFSSLLYYYNFNKQHDVHAGFSFSIPLSQLSPMCNMFKRIRQKRTLTVLAVYSLYHSELRILARDEYS